MNGPRTTAPPAGLPAQPHGPRREPAGKAAQLWVLTVRQIRLVYADSRVVLFSVAQPVVMLLLISQVFGSLADRSILPRGVSYIEFLLPALLVTTGIGTSQSAGVGLVRDMEGGMVRRFRVLPLSLPLVLVARSVADLTRSGMQLLVLVVGGHLLFGYRAGGGVGGLVAALLLSTLVIWALIWIFIALAAWLRKVEVLSSIGFFVNFPLMFASSAFVPVEVLPGWLAAVATVNPVSHAVEASRDLALGGQAGSEVPAALCAGLGLMLVMMLLAFRAFRRPPEE
ncbi:ABC transporter permease [Streptomyces pini]|uniref:Transport permease protein n=1 Tax=Streptomyces pini TaxID=1520580 RepID=A0A1I4H0W1_9ACTN|nr:ABC transporter permease [Streptomyces pini]SFL35825.1 ABC-2 type transport system permease protein [Streptomyces pini]